jgi:putative redox protein
MENTSPEAKATVNSTTTPWVVEITAGNHHWTIDEPLEDGGGNTAHNPYESLLAALGSCTNITVQMYAQRKQWPLHGVEVRLQLYREGNSTRIVRDLKLSGELDQAQRDRLLAVANGCPVHRVLTQPLSIETQLI